MGGRGPVILYGTAHIAHELGVTAPAVMNWRRRYNSTPPPTHRVMDGTPLWDESGIAGWRAWHQRHTTQRRNAGPNTKRNRKDEQ